MKDTGLEVAARSRERSHWCSTNRESKTRDVLCTSDFSALVRLELPIPVGKLLSNDLRGIVLELFHWVMR
jgi:hypothetical protein